MNLISSHAGLRGRPGQDLTHGLIEEISQRFAAFLADKGRPLVIAVGHDGRRSGPELAAAVGAESRRAGLDTVALGAVSTPAAKHYYVRRGLGGAIIVTGSHLAPELNGFKLVSGEPPCPVDPRALPAPRTVRARGAGSADHCAPGDHLCLLLGAVDVDRIRAAGMAASCTGGVGDTVERLWRALNIRRGSELQLRLDPDGDRLSVEGAPPDAVLLAGVVASRPDRLVIGADTSRAAERLLPGRVSRVAPGELHLVREMARTSASLAGEGNGGVIRRDLATGRDGLGAVLLLLELLAREATTLARVLESLPPIHIRRTTTVADRLHERAGALPGATDLGVERGVELMLEHGAWALVRASATEPVARVTVEGPDEQVDSLLRDLLERLEA